MSIRRTGLLAFVILVLAPGAASATGHYADLSGGGGGASGSKLWLFHSTFAWTIPTVTHPRRVSLVLSDFSVYHGSENGVEQTVVGYMAGGRVTFALGTDHDSPRRRVELSPHALIGVTHTNGGSSVTSGAVGGALDVVLGSHLSNEGGLGLRFLGDYVIRKGESHNLARFSAEVVYQFGHHH
jgi:hypothetical protein